jgi:hypothetical protein
LKITYVTESTADNTLADMILPKRNFSQDFYFNQNLSGSFMTSEKDESRLTPIETLIDNRTP